MSQKATYGELERRVEELERKLLVSDDSDLQSGEDSLGYRQMLESISDTVIVTNDKGRLRYVCPNTTHIFGLTSEEVLGFGTIQKIMGGTICSLSELNELQELSNIEWKITNASGTTRYLLINAKKVRIHDGTILYVMRDITDRRNAEKASQKIERKYQLAMEATADGIWDWDMVTGDVFYSDGWRRILHEESVSNRYGEWESRIHHEDREKTLAALNRHLERKTQQWVQEHRLKTGRGGYKWVLGRGRVVEWDPHGSPIRMVGTMTDISNQKKIENSLIEAEYKWKNILLTTPQIGIALDTKANIIFANDYFLSLTGWQREEILNKNWFELFIPESVRTEVQTVFDTTLARKDTLGFSSYENVILTKTGEKRNISWSNSLTQNRAGDVTDITCLGIDLTERIQAGEQLQQNVLFLESLSRIDRLIRHGTDAEKVMAEVLDAVLEIFECDRSWLVYPCDPDAQFWTVPYERTRPRYPGASVKNKKHPMTADVARDMRELLVTDSVLHGNYSDVKPEYDLENEFTIKSYLATAVFPKGSKPWEFGIHQCSHERVWSDWELRLFKEIKLRIEDALSVLIILSELTKSEEKFRALFEQAGGYCMILDPNFSDGIPLIIDANDAACAAHGYSREEFIGRPVADIDDEEGKLLVQRRTKQIMTGEPFKVENVHVRKDGTTFPVEVNAKRIDLRDGKPLILTTEYDITERKRVERELQEKTEFLDKVIESAALSTWISDENGTVIRANPACLEFFGATEDEILWKYNLFQDGVIEEKGYMPEIRRVFDEGEPANIVIDYDFGAVDHVDVRNPTHKTVNSIFTPILDTSGKVTNVIVQTIDLTDIKRMEKELIQAQKMESIGNLAGGIAHEFNNMLTIIIGNNELIMEDLPPDSLASESCEEIRVAGMRAREVVKQLLTFSRQDESAQVVMDFRVVVEESMKLIRSSTPANIEIEHKYAENIHPVLGNDTQINQLLINICNNAIDALPEKGGLLTVELENETIENSREKYHKNLGSGRYVKLVVADNGIGMETSILERIFEPYFTTKEIGKGTGIGMAVVHGIVERHGGAIMAESQPGQGTTITMYLPAHEGVAERKSDDRETAPSGEGQILYVDDESSIAKLGKRILDSLGYTTVSTTDPVEALEMVRNDSDRFDLVITDMAMPKMTGAQLIIEILKIRKEMPTIICTGYSSKISAKEAARIGIRSFVLKPLNKGELARTVRMVLDGERAESDPL